MNVEDVRSAHTVMEATRSEALLAAQRLHRIAAEALADGVRAVDIAEACDVTRSRVYQWARKA